jgi:hypothetical protein
MGHNQASLHDSISPAKLPFKNEKDNNSAYYQSSNQPNRIVSKNSFYNQNNIYHVDIVSVGVDDIQKKFN